MCGKAHQFLSEVPSLSCGENDAGRSSCGPTQYAIRRYIFLVEKLRVVQYLLTD